MKVGQHQSALTHYVCHNILLEGLARCDPLRNLDVPDMWLDL
jgi:hypothetical protein